MHIGAADKLQDGIFIIVSGIVLKRYGSGGSAPAFQAGYCATLIVCIRIGASAGVATAVALPPVDGLGIVKTQFKTVLMASFCQLGNNISAKRRAVHRVEIVPFRFKQGKAFVVFCGSFL